MSVRWYIHISKAYNFIEIIERYYIIRNPGGNDDSCFIISVIFNLGYGL
jgi:hypothetical protein